MKQITPQFAAHLKQDVTTLATCWKVTRTDGVVMGFTDHDRDILIDGINYTASSGYLRSAITNTATAAVDNLEVKGFLDNEAISEDELRNGVYDFATVEIFMVNWADLSMGIMRLRFGLFGEVQIYPSGLFVVELRGLVQMLSQTIGEIYVPECRADLGDNRCKIKLIPDQRLSRKSYAVGARVAIPTDPTEIRANIPFLNPGFEINGTTPPQMTLTNYARAYPRSTGGVYPLSGTGGLVEPFSVQGIIKRDHARKAGAVNARLKFNQYQIAAGSTLQGTLVFFNGQVEIGREVCLPAIETVIGAWEPRESADVPIPVNCTSVGWEIEWQGVAPNYAQVLLDEVVVTNDTVVIGDGFNSFNISIDANTDLALGWDGVTGFRRAVSTLILSPYEGDYYGRPSTNDFYNGHVYSQFPHTLISGPVTATKIDTGTLDLTVKCMMSAEETGWMGKVVVQFFDAAGVGMVGNDITIPMEVIIPRGQWKSRAAIGSVPVGARAFKIHLYWDRDTYQTNGRPRIAFDDFTIEVTSKGLDPNDLRRYSGMEFLCTTAGVAGDAAPNVTSVSMGGTVNDGSVVWTRVAPKYTWLGTVGSVTDNTMFSLPDVDAVDNWFQFGVVKFLTGRNAGKGMEVQSWSNGTKTLVTELPLPFTPSVGDVVLVHAGCDKSRGMCWDKFANIINMRAEPDIPGNDQYFQIGSK